MGSQFLGLSLFIMLLAFFIVLTSTATFDEGKIEKALDSLDLAFSSRVIGEEVSPSVSPSDARDFREGDTLDSIEKLFSAQLQNFKAQKNRFGTEMMITVAKDEFEEAIAALQNSNATAGNTLSFLDTLVSLLKSSENAIQYRVDIVQGVAENPALDWNNNAENIRQTAQAVSAWTDTIENAGLPRNLLSIGLDKNNADTVFLYFRPYEPIALSSNTESDVESEIQQTNEVPE